ncbi:MAG: N-6 DNA methylase [Acidobacteriota bacterium]|nr:N-6 DNA methylase [Acidobacteriota bacterium]
MIKENLFCRLDVLLNEADVEQVFLRRLLEHLGYKDNQIRPKESLTKLIVGGMRGQSSNYRPDFALKINYQVRWISEAKSPTESLDKHIWQPRGYCTLLNGQYKDENPVNYFLLSNGIKTRLYQSDINEHLLELDFDDFTEKNEKFKTLKQYLLPSSFISKRVVPLPSLTIKLEKRPLEDINAAFAWCHQHIYKKDNISQAAAFTEFVKVIFLKLLSDRQIRDKYPNVLAEEVIEVPIEDVKFSSKWIQEQEQNTPNPLDSIQFRDFINLMEREIKTGKRKRIFNPNESINLSPETVSGVVKRVEHLFLFGIDIDLNGRLFETFLNATMRGKDLGQFFTPRSVVKLGVKLSNIRINALLDDGSSHTDSVLDACCGTGGFLIDALAEMWKKVDKNTFLDNESKNKLKLKIANEHIFGVDVGREPPLARIARLNMYLHGDGGSSIYQIDALDKELRDKDSDPPEIALEKLQLRELLKLDGFADVIITNPPFAKTYERKVASEAMILDEYKIGVTNGGVKRASLKSSLMFIERYYDMLKIGGRIVTVIDDGILNGDSYSWFRDYIRNYFLIRAVISLPGDAFQRSKARVKTSLLIAEKRNPELNQSQPCVFMYGCEYVGIDDPARQRTLPIDRENREAARKELETVESEYFDFLSGQGNSKYIVSPERIQNRLDVKSCLMSAGRMVKTWKENGIDVVPLKELVELKEFSEEDIIETKNSDDFVTYLRVRYDGYAEAGDEIVASDTQYAYLYKVSLGDIVISNIAASYGSVAIVPKSLDGCVVASEYTVLRAKNGISPISVWLLLRSPEIRAEILLLATGISRNRVKWNTLKELQIPKPTNEIIQQAINLTEKATELEKEAGTHRKEAEDIIEQPLFLDTEEAHRILRAFKPPK